MGLFGLGEKAAPEPFRFQIADMFALRDGGVVVTGQVVCGAVRKGADVTCIPAQGEPFPCTITAIEQPDPTAVGKFVHPDAARADGPFQGRYAFRIPGRSKEEFRPGDCLISGNE